VLVPPVVQSYAWKKRYGVVALIPEMVIVGSIPPVVTHV